VAGGMGGEGWGSAARDGGGERELRGLGGVDGCHWGPWWKVRRIGCRWLQCDCFYKTYGLGRVDRI
jgi:hypothetical protein